MLRRHILAMTALAAPALAQPRGVAVVVPYAPGGITDALARLSADWLSQRLDRPFVVENQGGAAGAIAAGRVARLRPETNTLLFTNVGTLCLTPFVQRTEYTPESFAPVSIVGTSAFFLIAGPRLPVESLAGLIAAARAAPGRLSYASAGNTSLTHLATALVVERAGIEVTHVPYRGAGPAFADLLAGTVDFMTATPAELAGHMGGGAVKVLAVTSPGRGARWPTIPALSETLPGVAVQTWNGYVAPLGTAPALIGDISRELRAAARDPGFVARLDRLGTDPVDHSPDEFGTRIAADAAMWRGLVTSLGLQVGLQG
jgi:tripartite-type tricarboxylate transporter receptor subunit TctC